MTESQNINICTKNRYLNHDVSDVDKASLLYIQYCDRSRKEDRKEIVMGKIRHCRK